MSECSICGEYDEHIVPVDFVNANPDHPDTPEEIKPYLGIGHYLDDLDATEASEEFWENCAHLCPKCFNKYCKWIVWWG